MLQRINTFFLDRLNFQTLIPIGFIIFLYNLDMISFIRDKSNDIYLSAWLAFYFPSLIPYLQQLKRAITQKTPLKEFNSRLPEPLSKNEQRRLISKKNELQMICSGNLREINENFTHEMALMFGETAINTNYDIQFFKYKVLNDDYEAEQAYLEQILESKQMEKLREAIQVNKEKVQIHRQAYQKIHQCFQRRKLKLVDRIQKNWGKISLGLIIKDDTQLEAIENQLETEIREHQLAEYRSFIEEGYILLYDEESYSQTRLSFMSNQSKKGFLQNNLEINTIPFQFYNKIAEIMRGMNFMQKEALCYEIFQNSQEFLDFCNQLYRSNDWHKTIKGYYEKEDDFRNITQKLRPVIESQTQNKKKILISLLSYNFELNWELFWQKNQIVQSNLQNNIHQHKEFQKHFLDKVIRQSQTLLQIAKQILQYLYHCLTLKIDLANLMENLRQIIDRQPRWESKFEIYWFEVIELVPIIIKYCPSKEVLGYYLYNYRVGKLDSYPIPLYYRLASNQIQVDNSETINLLNQIDQCLLITNIGVGDKARKRIKSFLHEFFSLQTEQSKHSSSLQNLSITMYTVSAKNEFQKKLIILDINSDQLEGQTLFDKRIIQTFLKHSSLIFFHIDYKELKYESTSFYYAKLQNYLKSNICLVVNCNKNSQEFIQLIDFQGKQVKYMQRLNHSLAQKRGVDLKIEKNRKGLLQKIQKAVSFAFIQTLQQFKPKIVQKINSITNNLAQNIRKQGLVYEKIFPNTINYQKFQSNRLILSQSSQNGNASAFQSDYQQLTNIISQFKQLYNYNSRTFEERILCENLLSRWLQSYKMKTNNVMSQSEDSKIEEFSNNVNISLQNFILELIIYCQKRYSFVCGVQNRNVNEQLEIISSFYRQSLAQTIPITLLNGFSLSYGNQFLKQTLQNLQIYKKKKVYVISVIGCESSAKSSLLNYVFQTKFPVSIGKRTFGINMVVKEQQDKLLVVLDYQGLQSTARIDQNFDIRLASFAIVVSDLLIINHKGEMLRSLEEIVKQCRFVVEAINKKQMHSGNSLDCKPSRTVIALRDIHLNDLTNNATEQIKLERAEIQKLISRFNKNNNFFDNEMEIRRQDVFLFENAFVSQPNSTMKSSQQFVRKIQMLRNSILSSFEHLIPKNKSFQDFYTVGENTWEILRSITREELNKFKIRYEVQKQNELRQKICEEYQKQIKKLKIMQIIILQKIKGQLGKIQKQQDLQSKSKDWMALIYHSVKQGRKKIYQNLSKFIEENDQFRVLKNSQLKKYQLLLKNFQINERIKLNVLILEKRRDLKRQHYQLNITYELKKKIVQLRGLKKQQLRKYLTDELQKQLKQLEQEKKLEQQYLENVLDQKSQKSLQNQRIRSQLSQIIQETTNRELELCSIYKMLQARIKEQVEIIFNKRNSVYQIHDLHQYTKQYSRIVENGVNKPARRYLHNRFLSQKMSFQAKLISEDDPTISINIVSFFKTGMKIVEQTVQKSSLKREKDEFQGLLVMIQYSLVEHFQQLRNLFRFYSPIAVPNQISQFLDYEEIQLNNEQLFLSIFYGFIPKLALEKISSERIKNIQNQMQFRKIVNKTALKQLIIIEQSMNSKCVYWVERALQRFVAQETRYLKQKIEEIVQGKVVSPQKIMRKMLVQTVMRPTKSTSQDWIQCYKAVSNTRKYMCELYNNYYFSKKVLPLIKQAVKQTKKNITSKLQMFFQGVQNSHSSFLSKDLNQSLYTLFSLLLNGQLLYFEDYWRQLQPSFLKNVISLKQSLIAPVVEKYMEKVEKTANKYCQRYLKTHIYPQISGCEHKCLFCGMKCRFKRNHNGKHQVIPSTHLLYCFKLQTQGSLFMPNSDNNKVVSDLSWCCKKKLKKREEEMQNYILGTLSSDEIQWYQQIRKPNIVNDKNTERKLRKVWANIGEMLYYFVKNKKIEFGEQVESYKLDKCLKTSDIKRKKLQNYHLLGLEE